MNGYFYTNSSQPSYGQGAQQKQEQKLVTEYQSLPDSN
jgi:hypothetical protein